MVFSIALTGGIASGKSTISSYFSQLGVPVIDADHISHELVNNSPKLFIKLLAYFGSSIVTEKGELDRSALRTIIFSNEEKRSWLEHLLHPLIFSEIRYRLQKSIGPYCIVAIPLLFEEKVISLLKTPPFGDYIKLNRILLVVASREVQFQRAQERDGLQRQEVAAILASQILPSEAIKKSDDIIYNDSSLQNLDASVKSLHKKYLSFFSKELFDKSLGTGYYWAINKNNS